MRPRARSRRWRRPLTAAGASALLALGASALLAAGLGCSPAARPAPDCPAALRCVISPASSGNYDPGNRPADGLKIDSIVIHDTEATYPVTVSAFKDPAHQSAANYVVQSSTGNVTEMVRPGDVAWATGNWYYNTHSISIENEGFAAQGAAWFTRAEYDSDAALVRYLARRYGVPLDAGHIVGHDSVGGVTDADNVTQHRDPGPFWNWDYFMSLVRGESEQAYRARQGSAGAGGHHVVTISPDWTVNQPPVAVCGHGSCTALRGQPANLVYLRTRPGPAAPLLSDPTLHPRGGPGSTNINDWSATARAGDQYVLAGRRRDWTGIWFGGKVGWFYDPPGPEAAARFTGAWVVTPKPGLAKVPVYGAAFPEARAYPRGVSPRPRPALAYQLKAGQSYVTTGAVPDDDYSVPGGNHSVPGGERTVIRGNTPYDQIQFNHRLYYVDARDVTLKYLR